MTSLGSYGPIGSCDFLNAFVLGSLPVTKVTSQRCKVVVTFQPPVKHLPLAWILGQKDRNCTLAGVMARLTELEKREVNSHLRQDIRQAWICCSFAQKGRPEPFLESSYAVYGCHPDKVFPRWLAEQRAKLGPEFYLFYNDEGVLRPDVPKILQVSTGVRVTEAASSAAAGARAISSLAGHASPPTATHKGPGNAVAHEQSQSNNLPTTAHRANEADSLTTGTVGLVPLTKGIV